MKITLSNVRIAFADIFVPKAFEEGQAAKYKATFLIPKGSAQLKEVEAAIEHLANEKWGAKAAGILKTIRGNPNKFCLQDGDNKSYDGFEGMMYVGASNKVRPTVIDRDRSPLTQDDGKPYSGCYVNAIIEFFTYDNTGKGIAASLGGIQFVKDGEAFTGGRPANVGEFEDLGADELA